MAVSRTKLGRLLVAAVLMMSIIMPAVPAAAASPFEGGAYDAPLFVPNDHTPFAFRYRVISGLQPSTNYYLKVRFTVATTPSSATNRGFTWNPTTGDWVQERDPWTDFPVVTTDELGQLDAWAWAKFGDENVSGDRYLLVSLSPAGADDTYNSDDPPLLTVLDMQTEGSWIHNGVATGAAANKRAEATMDTSDTVVYALSKTEGNLIDDDGNGSDDEDYGPAGRNGDYRFGLPVATSVDVYLNRNTPAGTLQDFMTGPADTDLAAGAVEVSAPTQVTGLEAVPAAAAVDLSWDAASDDVGVAGYKVMRWVEPVGITPPYTPIHEVIATVGPGATTYEDSDVDKGVEYSYEVRAFDAAGNVGPRSDSAAAVPMGAGELDGIADQDRYLTSVAISRATYETGTVDTAVVATGMNYADALSASGLAGAHDAPLLLVGTYVKTETLAELDRLGVTQVLVIGGEAAVSPAVAAQLAAAGRTVERVAAGNDRYDTAAQVADAIIDEAGAPATTFFARGDGFADALAAAPVAYANKAPVLLVKPGSVPAYTSNAITSLGLTQGVALGGTVAIADSTLATLDGLMSGTVVRVSGADRYATAAAFADYAVDNALAGYGHVGIATGVVYADALSGGARVGAMGGVMLLTKPLELPAATATALTDNRPDIDLVEVYGGDAAVSQSVRDDIADLLQ